MSVVYEQPRFVKLTPRGDPQRVQVPTYVNVKSIQLIEQFDSWTKVTLIGQPGYLAVVEQADTILSLLSAYVATDVKEDS